jgi:hypothetical protein
MLLVGVHPWLMVNAGRHPHEYQIARRFADASLEI